MRSADSVSVKKIKFKLFNTHRCGRINGWVGWVTVQLGNIIVSYQKLVWTLDWRLSLEWYNNIIEPNLCPLPPVVSQTLDLLYKSRCQVYICLVTGEFSPTKSFPLMTKKL